jgi:cytochrome c oxidase subunit II
VRRAAAPLVALAAAGCSGVQSALDPAGTGAAAIYGLWRVLFWVCAAVFALVLGALLWAMLHRRGGYNEFTRPLPHPEPGAERRLRRVVYGALAATVTILVGFALTSYSLGRALFSYTGDAAVSVEITGHQWWWEVRYLASQPSRSFITANELHLPVGETVRITLRSNDVIHSFWVPNLNGKKDLIPGQVNILYLAADRPGRFRGECAEFCGLQHAFMGLDVIAEPKDDFERWRARQLRPAKEPETDEQRRGRQVFLSGPCAMCHAIQGTRAGGILGPNLTHLASRLSIGAGRLPNTRGHRAGWITDPQRQKPGNSMPPIVLPPDDLQALLAYLDSLE